MKRLLLSLLTLLVVTGAFAGTKTIWSGEWCSDDNIKNKWYTWRSALDIHNYDLVDCKAGDKLVFTANTRDNSQPAPRMQLSTMNGWDPVTYEGSEPSVPFSNGTYTLDVTSSVYEKIKDGFHIKGENFILTKIEVSGDGKDDVDLTDGSFHTSGTRLLDAKNNEFIMRGCNYSWVWQKNHENTVIPAAKRIGCNAIRIQLGTGSRYSRTTKQELEYLIKLCEQNKLVAVFNTHDETGSNSEDDLVNAANFWIEMKDVLNAHLSTVIVNISNEWYGNWNQADKWASGYKRVIPMMRNAGIKNTLIVDCAGWGQWPQSIWEKGTEVAATDTEKNIVFSMHVYNDLGKDDYTVQNAFEKCLAINIPLLVGEFAYQHGGKYVAYQKVMDLCQEKKVGYLVWSWTGNGGGVEDCDMFGSYDDSQYKPNGEKTVKGRNGIKETSVECTVFDPNVPSQVEEIIPESSEIDWTMPVEIYDMSGRRVNAMQAGSVYVVRQGMAVKKVVGK